MVEKEKFLELKAKADLEFAERKKKQLIERSRKNMEWTRLKAGAMVEHDMRKLDDQRMRGISSINNRPGEILGKSKTRGMKKSDGEWVEEMKKEMENKTRSRGNEHSR